MKVNLKAKPYYLRDEDIKWVEDTIAGMTTEEKIGQLFIGHFHDMNLEHASEIIEKYHVGGARYKDANTTKKEVYDFLKHLQAESKLPLLIAANCDNGGDGCCGDGTYVATAAAVEASGSEKVAYYSLTFIWATLTYRRKSLIIGGRYWDRTSDPCRVKAVLYR